MIYSIEKITTLIGAHRFGKESASIGWLLTDSRSLAFPEATLFFAIHTQRNDGHKYIPQLYSKGVRNFVVETLPTDFDANYPKANFLRVPNSLKAIQRLAERHRDEFQVPVIGITGSNGKTIVKEWLFQILSQDRTVTRSPRSYNSQIGVPLSVWRMDNNTEIAILEAGISQPNEMKYLRDIIQPTIGIITNIGSAHQENFESLEQKCMEKIQLFKEADIIICPEDSDDNGSARINLQACFEKANIKGKIIRWSRKDAEKLSLPFEDQASIDNACICYSTLLQLGLPEQTIIERMKQLEPVALRMEVKEGNRGLTLINDSYNSDVVSLDIALTFMARRKDAADRRKLLILSDILQTGMEPEELYTEVSRLANIRGVDCIIGIGEAISDNQELIEVKDKHFFLTTNEFMESELFRSLANDIVLIKGARCYHFDRISDALELKVHETILEVNLNAIVDNLNFYRSHMQEQTKLVAMVKADAYGTGAVEVSKVLQDHQIDYLAVAVADEGVELRKAGITTNIMIMNPEMTAFKTMFDYKLEPEVYNFRLLNALIKAAQQQGITDYPVHIKLDTGMHRLGFNPETEVEQLVEILKSQCAITPRSVFSHFVGADEDRFDDFSAEQFRKFEHGSSILQSAFSHHILRHIDNSAGIIHFHDRQMDMCRLGIGLYGVNNRDNSIINNVSTLKTTILQIRDVRKEDTVGYSKRGVLERDSRIAAIPIGYADGLNRHLGRGNCYCLVNGKKAPYVGNICMDVTMIDVTDIDCQEGDCVEIFGSNLPVTVLSDALDTIPYEVLTSVSSRVKKIYVQE
ncbi:MAG: bifunctional UDP-N-acetylmuramoyl-tripeptide:D-alanyl-D-alanine ligase/alanine racemase [Bacteroidaceae bacterium]|nr:bifunctional UDP-N-acetylmuramoyl-tripeptide:D-alanyl-D-alanine ligase/alanine racemase [Bacteroidaceae bacterium]